MKDDTYKILLKCLKACEKNYHSHVREFGKLDKTDINFWAEQLQDFSAERLKRSFSRHIQNSSFFPTVHDIRSVSVNVNNDPERLRRLGDNQKLLVKPEDRIRMPQKMKDMLRKLTHEVTLKKQQKIC